jgi:serine phosphatase RsbU (regulator of sigma subunit)
MKKLLISLLFFIPIILHAQNIDSLKNNLKSSNDDNYSHNLLQLGQTFFELNLDSSWYYSEQALHNARINHEDKELADILRFCGKLSYYQGQYDSCLFYTQESIKLYQKLDNKPKLALTLNNIGIMYSVFGMMDSCYICHQRSLKINIELNDSNEISETYNNIGTYYLYSSKFDSARYYYNVAITYLSSDKNSTEASILNNIALAYQYEGNFEKAINIYVQSLTIYEEINETRTALLIYNNIGSLYKEIGYYNKAIEYFTKKSDYSQKMGDQIEYCKSLNNIAGCFAEMDQIDTAITIYKSAIPLFNSFEDKETKAMIYKGIADCEVELKQYNKSLEHAQKALELRLTLNNENQIYRTYFTIAKSYDGLENYQLAEKYYRQCEEHSTKSGDVEIKLATMIGLAETLEKRGNYRESNNYLAQYIALKDSLMNSNVQQQISDLETKYQTEKKEQQILLQNVELEKNQVTIAFEKAEAEKKAAQRNLFMFGFGLILILAIVIFRGYRQKAESNKIIAEKNDKLNQLITEVTRQKDEIEKQKIEIEEIHHEVSQSISYAKRIQTSILPSHEILLEKLSDSFILFKPRDVVSGDFYWFTQIENQLFATVADCTGHGVPGAFMSMLGVSFLREIVNKSNIKEPNKILDNLRNEVIRTLKQKGISGESKDGMDMSFIRIDFDNLVLDFSGANNPLYIISQSEPKVLTPNSKVKSLQLDESDTWTLYEVKPDKMPIAIYEKMNEFQNNRLQLHKHDRIYMFSDGFVDQFGGPKEKKFMSKPFKRLLLEHASLNMQEQKDLLDQTIISWMKETNQVDDISIMGVEI